jgi:selenocysteine-specific elongation factor
MARVTILDQEKIAPGGHGLVMLRLESPIIAVRNERCLVRTYSPMTLIGSGTILEAYPEQYQRTRQETIEYLNALRQPGASRIEQLIRYRAVPLREEKELMKAANLSLYETKQHLAKLMIDGTVLRLKDGSLVHRLTYARIRESFVELLRTLHDHMPTMRFLPITAVTRQEKSLPPVLLDKIIADMTGGGIIERRENCVRLAGHTVSLPAEFLDLMNRVEHWAILTGYKTLTLDKTAAAFPDLAPDTVKKAITYLVDTGRMVEIAPGVYIPNATLKAAEQVLRVYLKEKKQIRASDFKDLIAVSRETARAILDHFLRRGITIRIHGTHTLADQPPNGTDKKIQHP